MSDQATLDKLARQQGFHDYATMVAWHQRQSEALHQNTTTAQQAPPQNNAMPQTQPPANQMSWYQRLINAFSGVK